MSVGSIVMYVCLFLFVSGLIFVWLEIKKKLDEWDNFYFDNMTLDDDEL